MKIRNTCKYYRRIKYVRDINRIDPFLQKLGTIWKTQCPDWRFGQLIFNVERVMKTHGKDLFYQEEDQLLDYIKEFFKEE